MKHVEQPPRSKCCGQACVAMVLGRMLADIVAVIGNKGTHYTTLRRAAWHYSREFSPVIMARSQPLPDAGVHIARIIWSRKPHASHFVVLVGRKVHDPECDQGYPRDMWLQAQRDFRNLPDLTFTSWMTLQ
jgi:hypothetical protein